MVSNALNNEYDLEKRERKTNDMIDVSICIFPVKKESQNEQFYLKNPQTALIKVIYHEIFADTFATLLYLKRNPNNENDIQYSVSAFGYPVEPVEPGRLVFVYSFNFFRCFHCSSPLNHCALTVNLTNDRIRRQNRNTSGNRLYKGRSGRHTGGRSFQLFENIYIQSIYIIVQRIGISGHLIEQTEIGIENLADRHQCQRDDGRQKARQRNVNDLLPAVCAVDDRRLIVAVVNADNDAHSENPPYCK